MVRATVKLYRVATLQGTFRSCKFCLQIWLLKNTFVRGMPFFYFFNKLDFFLKNFEILNYMVGHCHGTLSRFSSELQNSAQLPFIFRGMVFSWFFKIIKNLYLKTFPEARNCRFLGWVMLGYSQQLQIWHTYKWLVKFFHYPKYDLFWYFKKVFRPSINQSYNKLIIQLAFHQSSYPST